MPGAPARDALHVAVLAGGRSSEHDVSLSSAAAVRDGLRAAGHRITWIEIDRDGRWRVDGATVQGMLEMLDVPYVGAGVTASAVCMDKVLFKDLMATLGLPQVRYAGIGAAQFEADPRRAIEQAAGVGLPSFVKPAHLGSSVGIVKVDDRGGLGEALGVAFSHDPLAIVEAAAAGVEVECGVLELSSAEVLASEPGEIVFEGEFYDYEAKYTPGGMELLIPARISPSARARVRELAGEVFRAVGCEGLARVDFFVDGEEVLINELNTMPGFTPTSVYAKLLEASGVPYPQLVDRLCRLAIARHAVQSARRH